ncbi:hypothetical protein NP493_741g01035 [Ridgeia piscesae]|uniref:G-protein coupled receptors family 2 profile 2 domain-containing protein n=1 Tax=Ridgeia piscesae TaxID=27915 RepID=A0AAD9KQ00_RIDPI|nr:hypothetical protein NP493_741g01035 [Ridgeia piscesae]
MFEPFVTGRTHTYRDVEWLCKAMNVLQNYTVMANIFWTFVEGLFLHNRVAVSVFNKEAPFKIFHTIGWGLPAMIVFTWSSFMHKHNSDGCWNGYFDMPYIWIILVPIIASLTVSLATVTATVTRYLQVPTACHVSGLCTSC